jgi:hypothetical protein
LFLNLFYFCVFIEEEMMEEMDIVSDNNMALPTEKCFRVSSEA